MTYRFFFFIALAILSGTLSAQVSQGGAPWKWGQPDFQADYPELTTAELDLEVLSAEDAVTDQFKEAPWRFGVEREVDLGLEDAGVWTLEKDRWIPPQTKVH